MTNKPMLSVERELLEELQWHYKPYDDYYHKESGYYCPMCHEEKSKGHDATCEIKAAFDKPAAQHHGKPVAKLHAERLTGKDGEYGVTVEDSEWFNSCRQTGGIFNLYAEPPAPVALTVWYGSMPESNGKTNWTAILHRKGEAIWSGAVITIDRSEYPDRVRYEADRMRYLIGELTEEPDILDYDDKLHSGYVNPHKPAPVADKAHDQ